MKMKSSKDRYLKCTPKAGSVSREYGGQAGNQRCAIDFVRRNVVAIVGLEVVMNTALLRQEGYSSLVPMRRC